MAESKKVTANEQVAQEQQAQATTVTETNVQAQAKAALMVERETFTTKDGREMYGYFVRGEIRGRKVKVDFNAKDQGGYETLDLIFDINPKAELLIHEETQTDNDGTKRKYTVYEVQNVDENGIVYKYKIKPARESDKTYLDILLQQIAVQVKKD